MLTPHLLLETDSRTQSGARSGCSSQVVEGIVYWKVLGGRRQELKAGSHEKSNLEKALPGGIQARNNWAGHLRGLEPRRKASSWQAHMESAYICAAPQGSSGQEVATPGPTQPPQGRGHRYLSTLVTLA